MRAHVFHSPHAGQRPTQRGDVAAHDEQAKWTSARARARRPFVVAMTAPYEPDVTGRRCKDRGMDAPSVDERRDWAGRLGDDDLADSVVPGLTCLHSTEGRAPRPPAELAGWVRVAVWNVQRGHRPGEAAARLRASGAQIALLSELDSGMARTGNEDVAAGLAAALGDDYGYVYAVEFVELGLGDNRERAGAAADDENARGMHGNAIVARTALADHAVVRLDAGRRWFAHDSPEPRLGGRMAVLATVVLDGTAVRVASTHLENRADPAERATQFETVLNALGPGPALVGGDLNTFGTGFDEILDRPLVRRLHSAEPERFLWPVAHEPLFEAAAAHGLRWEGANAAVPTTSLGPLKLDWLLTRGLEVCAPTVVDAAGLSDHHLVAATVRVER
jgi:endonuclease/exonuclease/phosphatase family metal-dependent hydrolase